MYQVVADEHDFIIIHKFSQVHFHSQDGHAGVVAQAEQDLGLKLFPVHRLDTMTSGLLILAKSSAAAATFTQLFEQHQVQKYYIAIAKGKPKKKQGWIIGDMAKSRRSMYKLLRSTKNPAKTLFFSHALGEGVRLYLLKPLSGKTHQLRVALASIGVPILGDPLYGKGSTEGEDRGYLHAFVLAFRFHEQDYCYQCLPEQGVHFRNDAVVQQLQLWSEPASLDWPKSKK
ncbi:TIGR01621 family pseudouridine synthase [Shewanella gelidii]|uniref:RNA pseudouridine synthase n=1 Tax=Shewanella gelidii TaxID=1642821 RepID=A0A917NCN4_9GAMM|nr:TIGR01621 family pseudouridine synthase [Shewanella gelidii]MCL1098887.1 TIGR01621 family pseudouridine synthase [Shewanella gelidii]GGI89727.1 RNA pseudouridine synthase [Shewanella gelidii]